MVIEKNFENFFKRDSGTIENCHFFPIPSLDGFWGLFNRPDFNVYFFRDLNHQTDLKFSKSLFRIRFTASFSPQALSISGSLVKGKVDFQE